MSWLYVLYALLGVGALVALGWLLHRAFVVHRRLKEAIVVIRGEKATAQSARGELERKEEQRMREEAFLWTVLSYSFNATSVGFRHLSFAAHRAITAAALRAKELFEESIALRAKGGAGLTDDERFRLETIDADIEAQKADFYARHKAAAEADLAVLWEAESRVHGSPGKRVIMMATYAVMFKREGNLWGVFRVRITAYYPEVGIDQTFLPDSAAVAEGHVGVAVDDHLGAALAAL